MPAHLVVASLVLALGLSPAPGAAPSVPLRDVHGEPISLYALRGRVVLLDAWATWCAPCLADLPMLKRMARTHPDTLAIVGISMDRMPRRDFISWLRRKDVTWRQHFDGRGYDSPAAEHLGINAVPDTWLYDANGRLVARGLRGAQLEAAVALLIERDGRR
jgi:thiol-disulfide isomerase/thioredoxin